MPNSTTYPDAPRMLCDIARDIRKNWSKVNFAAKPYLRAMADLETMSSEYGYDSAASIVRYFLSNATSWRGDVARAVKAELKAMLPKSGRR